MKICIINIIIYFANTILKSRKEVFHMNLWHELPKERVTPEEFDAVIEISRYSKLKYELDKETGHLKLDRILHTSTHYPANYGFIPKTYADDDDPLDVLVLCNETIQPLSLVTCRPIGVITMVDDDSSDEKIIAVPVGDPTYNGYTDISQLPKHIFDEMAHFFEVYKALEHTTTAVDRIDGKDVAVYIIKKCIEYYDKTFN